MNTSLHLNISSQSQGQTSLQTLARPFTRPFILSLGQHRHVLNACACVFASMILFAIPNFTHAQAQIGHYPQWEEITEASTPALRFYIDKNTLHRPEQNPQWINVTILSQTADLMLAPPDHQSDTTDLTIDCENKALRINTIRSYSRPNATGNVTQVLEGNNTFTSFSSEGKDARLFSYICKP